MMPLVTIVCTDSSHAGKRVFVARFCPLDGGEWEEVESVSSTYEAALHAALEENSPGMPDLEPIWDDRRARHTATQILRGDTPRPNRSAEDLADAPDDRIHYELMCPLCHLNVRCGPAQLDRALTLIHEQGELQAPLSVVAAIVSSATPS